jgi:hypothetical protein
MQSVTKSSLVSNAYVNNVEQLAEQSRSQTIERVSLARTSVGSNVLFGFSNWFIDCRWEEQCWRLRSRAENSIFRHRSVARGASQSLATAASPGGGEPNRSKIIQVRWLLRSFPSFAWIAGFKEILDAEYSFPRSYEILSVFFSLVQSYCSCGPRSGHSSSIMSVSSPASVYNASINVTNK